MVIDKDDGIRSDFTMKASREAVPAWGHANATCSPPALLRGPTGAHASSTQPCRLLPSPPLHCAQKLQKMHPVFSKGGTTTVGNACQVRSGITWQVQAPAFGCGLAACRLFCRPSRCAVSSPHSSPHPVPQFKPRSLHSPSLNPYPHPTHRFQTTDGAACVMLMSRAEAERRGLPIMASLRSFAAVGVHPSVMGIGPVSGVAEG